MSQIKALVRKLTRSASAALVAACVAALLVPIAARAQAAAPDAAPGIPVELNKLEPITQGGPACRVYFLVANPDAESFDQLQVDLILFGGDGVIARRVALNLGPLPPKKQAVRLFDLQGIGCDDVGKVLVNDVISCTHKGAGPATDADRAACLDRLVLTSRTKAPLTK